MALYSDITLPLVLLKSNKFNMAAISVKGLLERPEHSVSNTESFKGLQVFKWSCS